MQTLALLLAFSAAVAFVVYALGIWATVRHTRRLPAPIADERLPSISLLKPLKGCEESLEQNLRTFFEQDYPAPFEIVFGSTEPDDPGIVLARRLAREYPNVPARFVRTDPSFGLNPKVANLAGTLAAAKHDLVLQSDGNVRVRRDYLRLVVGELVAKDASLLSSIVVGVGEQSTGAAMENLQLSAYIAPGTCAALHVGGVCCVIGKSMLFRRSELRSLGGIELVRDILCEDFMIGQRYQSAGKRVVLSSVAVENVNEHTSVVQFLSRHGRWMKMRVVIDLRSYVADLFSNPVGLLLLAVLASGFVTEYLLALVGATVLKLAGDAFLVFRTRGHAMAFHNLLLAPIKDVLMLGVFVHSAFSRSVEWRGVRLRFGAESRLRHDDGSFPVRVVRRLASRL